MLKTSQGIRGFKKPLEENLNLVVEFGDVVIYLCHLCNKLGWRIEDCIWSAYDKIEARHSQPAGAKEGT